ncbi:MAG: nuclear transport factor 2 family protein [Acidimicrobiia bacterium]
MTSQPSPPTPPHAQDRADVEAIARDYIDGWYSGDMERMDRSLHSELVKRAADIESEDLRVVTRERMLELTQGGGGDAPDAENQVVVDDVSEGIACVRVLSPDYVDYLHLVKTGVGWKIANVLFRTRP